MLFQKYLLLKSKISNREEQIKLDKELSGTVL